MPLVAYPGERGALALDGAYESYTSMAGPTWRNEVDAAVGFEMGGIRTTSAAKRLQSRLLVQIADFDRYVPAESVAKTAVHGRAEVHHYPCDHFDVWPGHDWFDKVSADQVAFVAVRRAHLARPRRSTANRVLIDRTSVLGRSAVDGMAAAVTNFDSSLASHSTASAMSPASAMPIGRKPSSMSTAADRTPSSGRSRRPCRPNPCRWRPVPGARC